MARLIFLETALCLSQPLSISVLQTADGNWWLTRRVRFSLKLRFLSNQGLHKN